MVSSGRECAVTVTHRSCSLSPQETLVASGRMMDMPGLRRVNDGHIRGLYAINNHLR